MNTLEKRQYVQRELTKKGFHNLPRLELDPAGTPVCILTNCCIYEFDETLYARTATKTYYAPTGQSHLLNVSAATALKLMERGQRVIMHVPAEVRERMETLLALHPQAELCQIVTGDMYKQSVLEIFYEAVVAAQAKSPVSRVDFCLYDSYASGLTRPFLPMFEDDPATAGQLAASRINFLFYASMMAYDLLTRCGQKELRFVCPTALATKRPSAHLFTDTVHKAVSNVLLHTLGYEFPYYCEKPARIVEVAPGIVDTGLYDEAQVRDMTYEESLIDGFPLAHGSSLDEFPMLSVDTLADVCLAYLCADSSNQLSGFLAADVSELLRAGRSQREFEEAMRRLAVSEGERVTVSRDLPEYCYMPGSVWGELPPIRPGYTPVFLTPVGQRF